MNNLRTWVRGVIFLLMSVTLSACLTQLGSIGAQLNNHSISQPPVQEEPLKHFPLPSGLSVKELHFIWDNQHILAIQSYHGAVLFDLSSAELLHSYFLDEVVASAHLFNQKRYLLLQGRGIGDIWDLAAAKPVFEWRDPDTGALATAVSKQGQYVFTGQYLYRMDTGKRVLSISAQNHAALTAAAISPDETLLATGGTWDDRVLLWDIQTGKRLDLLEIQQPVKALCFSPDSRYLYISSHRRWVVYEVATQTQLFAHVHPFSWRGGHYLAARDALLVVSSSGAVQLAQAADGEVIWHYQAGQEIIAYNADPQRDLVLALKSGTIMLVDMKTGEEWLQLKHDFYVDAVAVSADRTALVAAIARDNKTDLVVWQLPQPAP